MGQFGGHGTVGGPADTEHPTGHEAEASADSEPMVPFFTKHRGLIGLVAAAVVALLLQVRWYTLPPDRRYLLPTSQADWTAWGTWAGAFGAIAAVAFAAKSIKQAIEAQQSAERKWTEDRDHDREEREKERQLVREERAELREESNRIAEAAKKAIDQAAEAQRATERELKADRRHDREEREKERQLVREEREELKQERDRIVLHKASQLTFWYSRSHPPDDDYLVVKQQDHDAEADRNARIEAGEYDWSDEYPGDGVTDKVFVIVENASEDVAFEELSLVLCEKDLDVTQIRLFEREAPPTRRSEVLLPGEPPKWRLCTDYEPDLPLTMKRWALGSIKPRMHFMVELTFATPQSDLEWGSHNLFSPHASPSDIQHLILEYRDSEKRHWIRSTKTVSNPPRRLIDVEKLLAIL